MPLKNQIQGFGYCEDYYGYARFSTRVVNIGEVPLGGNNPIRLQSMTNTDTNDIGATVAQAIRMIAAGCEYVRITAQGLKEAENLRIIKQTLKEKGYAVPIIADVHFNPKVAEAAALYVEKVRINPGNYTDRNKGRAYTAKQYDLELEKISERLNPLINICKQYGTAIRIGSNHGSLSERILDRYGDTPEGMTEAAMEFIRICRDKGFHQMVISMKSSNVKIMVQSTRLLVHKMMAEGMDYPVHLGVTEAGDGEDGRIRSAAGIGALLEDGIGDTIRVSLTEDPEAEIPVARELADYYSKRNQCLLKNEYQPFEINPFSFSRRYTAPVNGIGGGMPPIIITSDNDLNDYPDALFINVDADNVQQIENISPGKNNVFIVGSEAEGIKNERKLISDMIRKELHSPVILKKVYNCERECLIIRAAADYGCMLADGLVDGIWIDSSEKVKEEDISEISAAILQSTGDRISKAEFISCPSCGRTTYNIQGTLKEIKARASHLTGLKIGVMGCIVNGPGEMADAHYGYVGAGKGKITLYKGKKIIRKNVDEKHAVDALIELIRENGDWKDNAQQGK